MPTPYDTSITLVSGALSRAAERRDLKSGDSLVNLALRVSAGCDGGE